MIGHGMLLLMIVGLNEVFNNKGKEKKEDSKGDDPPGGDEKDPWILLLFHLTVLPREADRFFHGYGPPAKGIPSSRDQDNSYDNANDRDFGVVTKHGIPIG
jgi:hypothetical protein